MLDLELDEDLDEGAGQDWTPIEVETRTLRMENFRVSDIGGYR